MHPQISRQDEQMTFGGADSELDEINRTILSALAENPRLSMTALARLVGMSSPSVTERVRRLEETGVIQGYHLIVNPAALGLPLTAIIRIRPNSGQHARVADLVRSIAEVVECHRVTGDDCFIATVHFSTMAHLERLIDRILCYGSTTTSIVQSSPVTRRALPIAEQPTL